MSWLDTSLEDCLSGCGATITGDGRFGAGRPAFLGRPVRPAQPPDRNALGGPDNAERSRDETPPSAIARHQQESQAEQRSVTHGQTGQLIPLPTLDIMAPIRSIELSGSAPHRVVFAGERQSWWRTYAQQGFRVHLPDGASRAWAEHYADLFGAEHAQALSDLVHELPPVGRSEETA